MRLHVKSRYLNLEDPAIMGILNVTPDSFSDGGKFVDPGRALARAEEMVREGAVIIDVGGESTRPGSRPVDADEEIARVIPVIRRIKDQLDLPVSIDTCKERVARVAVEEGGADIVNDISGLRFSERMAETVARLQVPVVLMHIRGTPENMQQNPEYADVVKELSEYFSERIRYARSRGIQADRIILDPGIGFGKRLRDNIDLLRNLDAFAVFDCPLMVGVSRKSFLGALGGELVPEERVPETLAAGLAAVLRGANLLRVHDVAAAVRSIKVFRALGMLDGRKDVAQ